MNATELTVSRTAGEKLPYETPELSVLGDVQDITKQYDVSVNVN